MAQLLNSTRFKSPATSAASFNVTIPATAAGSTLVCVAGGGATIQAKLGGSSGVNFTKRTSSLNNREVVAQDITDGSGGTTSIGFLLNGPENIDGMIFEFAPGTIGSYIAGATQGGGSSVLDGDWQTGTQDITTSTPTILFSMFTAGDTFSDPGRKFYGLEPLGKILINEYIINDPSKSTYWSMIGISDQSAAGTFIVKSSRIVNGAGGFQNVVWSYEDLDPGTPTYANPYPNVIAAENSLPGSRSAVWFGATIDAHIVGYTDAISYSPGDTVNFNIDSQNTGFDVEVFRHGHYGYLSFGAKRKATISGTPAVQPAPTIDGFGGTVCAWTPTASWGIPLDATPGIYIYNMRRTDNSSYVSQGIFIVRSPVPVSQNNQIMLATAEFTWQAYNVWGSTNDAGNSYGSYTGRSLYGQAPSVQINGRAFAVSFDRPLGTVGANGASFYWDSEGGLVNFLEGNGYDMAYFSSTDIDKDNVIPSRFKVAISSGHSEYWTEGLRDGYENARAAGTNLMVLSSNTALWHVRFDAGDTNRRTMICYKDSHDTVGYDGLTKYDPDFYTGTWRDIRTIPGGVNNLSRRPEPSLGGQWFIGNGPFSERIAVTNSFASLPIWRNTRVATGGSITYRGSTSGVLTTAGTQIDYAQPANTEEGDLLVVAIVFASNPGTFVQNGLRIVRQNADSPNQWTYLLTGYANVAGAAVTNFVWANAAVASLVVNVYGGAVWWDTDAALQIDTGGTASHATRFISNVASDTWAVCAFADTAGSVLTKTTSWSAGSGLTTRVGADTSSGAGPWNSIALMDSNNSVTMGSHQYDAVAQFANPHAAAGILYISPGSTLAAGTIGYEWDYVKRDEPTTPTNLVMLAEQPIPLPSQASSYNGDGYQNGGIYKYGISLFKDDTSDALVLNAGTWRYQWGISRMRSGNNDLNGTVDVAMQQAIINVLKDMGVSYAQLLGTPENNDPTPLVDPGASATAAQYGLTLTDPGYQHIFASSQVPSTNSSNGDDGSDYTFGTVFSSSTDGNVHGIRWYFPDDLPNDHVIGLLYSWTNNGAGVELARVTFKNTQSGWNQAEFASPVAVTSGTKYVAAVWTVDRFVTSQNMFSSAAVANGDLTAPQDVAGVHNGKLKAGTGSPSYPDSSVTSNGYLADVLYIASSPSSIQFEGWGIPIN